MESEGNTMPNLTYASDPNYWLIAGVFVGCWGTIAIAYIARRISLKE